jgi:hypothetical protein
MRQAQAALGKWKASVSLVPSGDLVMFVRRRGALPSMFTSLVRRSRIQDCRLPHFFDQF